MTFASSAMCRCRCATASPAADVYLPAGVSSGPVILSRTPYEASSDRFISLASTSPGAAMSLSPRLPWLFPPRRARIRPLVRRRRRRLRQRWSGWVSRRGAADARGGPCHYWAQYDGPTSSHPPAPGLLTQPLQRDRSRRRRRRTRAGIRAPSERKQPRQSWATTT